MNINATKESINDNIKVIEGTLFFSEYHAEEYRNHARNTTKYIVIHNDGNKEYIDCLMLDINVTDYLGIGYLNVFNSKSDNFIKPDEFDIFYHNGFLGINYNGKLHDKQNINKFFEKYGGYFIFAEDLKNHILELYDEVYEEIEIRDKLDELFWNK